MSTIPTARELAAHAASREVDADLQDARDALTRDLNLIINTLAGRRDVLLNMVWDRPDVAVPAWFDPGRAEVSINAHIALGDDVHPDDVDPITTDGRLRHPVLIGLCCHEASHAHSTRWQYDVPDGTPPLVLNAASLLEDIRIEHRQLGRRPSDRVYLRATSEHLILPPRGAATTTLENRWRAAQFAALVFGRVDAGILEAGDVLELLPMLHAALGVSTFETLRDIWCDVLTVADGDTTALLAAARRWIGAVGADENTDPDHDGTRMPGSACSGHHGDHGRHREDGRDDAPDLLADAAAAALAAVTDAAIKDAAGEITPPPDSSAGDKAVAEHDVEASDRDDAEAAAAHVFAGRGSFASPVRGTRAPTSQERREANRLAAALRSAQYRARAKRRLRSDTPPGRVDGREIALGRAQLAAGIPVTARPFRRVERHRVPQPPITVGIAVDVSGSMGWAESSLASAAWIVAWAVHQVSGTSATVTFGDAVTPITRPRMAPDKVTEFSAEGSTEEFVTAVQALDGQLRLASGKGARLLVVVSDGDLVKPGELEAGQRLVSRLAASGVGVIWLDLHGRSSVMADCAAVQLDSGSEAAAAIGKAAVSALRQAR
ncbi:VWA domain-containing protein (plasmid) [Pseudonocardia sp. DSM 110487]|uniref:VWA domain-containing protein n=1 Tax=Pseudonocardia sp. DSM 110487 TaxID=2865833 RepID=UPI001C6A48F7|nr:VWA domain-containing protein [Pseudonocardia sp. DSM 110487]QYN41024.1 VWA domain-containing protein [Pseudonocardia sp. DSM 110487]